MILNVNPQTFSFRCPHSILRSLSYGKIARLNWNVLLLRWAPATSDKKFQIRISENALNPTYTLKKRHFFVSFTNKYLICICNAYLRLIYSFLMWKTCSSTTNQDWFNNWVSVKFRALRGYKSALIFSSIQSDETPGMVFAGYPRRFMFQMRRWYFRYSLKFKMKFLT